MAVWRRRIVIALILSSAVLLIETIRQPLSDAVTVFVAVLFTLWFWNGTRSNGGD